jgi:predicted nucleic-acid-binding Zn-ribbon protein
MLKVEQCAKCGSSSLIQRAMVIDKVSAAGAEENFTVRVDADPSAMCGYIELYADNPGELYQAFITTQSTVPDIT